MIYAHQLNERHISNLAKASRPQIDLARLFQRAAFDDGIVDDNITRREMSEQPDTFIPAPLYLDMAIKFTEADWRAKLIDALNQ